jgi:small subunit ribosomal protein S25e
MTMKVVTPYEIASKYGIKMSIALKILRALRDRGDLTLVAKGHRTEIYVPVRKS